ncbi:MAG: threonine aldolase family protein [Propionibacteriaceae bacterium]|nr:threonine aldolase family protein [Propionibacteriaceae bacterium]
MIDLRSDTITRPTQAMRQAMFEAPVGDDVYGEDPTIRQLEERAAALLGQQAALFCASGSLANLLGVWLLVPRGGELLCDSQAHVVRAEAGAHAALHGVQTRTWTSRRGLADPTDVIPLLAEPTPHLVSVAAVELENSHNFGGGTIQPVEAVAAIAAACRQRGMGLHLDGARLANAAVACHRPLADWGREATTVTLCLSKGLGAPVGTILASSPDRIARARQQRKRLGGGWRQAGVLAAAGLHALDHHIDRLAHDHANARLIRQTVQERAPQAVTDPCQTNIVILRTAPGQAERVARLARQQGVLVSQLDSATLRVVTHLDVTAGQCAEAADILADLLAAEPVPAADQADQADQTDALVAAPAVDRRATDQV